MQLETPVKAYFDSYIVFSVYLVRYFARFMWIFMFHQLQLFAIAGVDNK